MSIIALRFWRVRSLILTASFLALTVSRVVAQSTPDEFFETSSAGDDASFEFPGVVSRLLNAEPEGMHGQRTRSQERERRNRPDQRRNRDGRVRRGRIRRHRGDRGRRRRPGVVTRDRTRPRQERERPYAGSRGPGVRQRDGEVGSEGGTPGDVELDIDWGAGAGSEAGETWQPTN